MRACLALLLLGCNHDALPNDNPDLLFAAGDLTAAPVFDLAFDLADECALAAPNSTVSLGGSSLPYCALGNVDVGNESNCGGNPEGVVLVLSGDNRPSDSFNGTVIRLALPIKMGMQSGTVSTRIGGFREAPATVTVTGFMLRGSGPGLDSLAGDVDAPGLSLSGHFAAAHCGPLDVVCI